MPHSKVEEDRICSWSGKWCYYCNRKRISLAACVKKIGAFKISFGDLNGVLSRTHHMFILHKTLPTHKRHKHICYRDFLNKCTREP
jgi:hypothetical protein